MALTQTHTKPSLPRSTMALNPNAAPYPNPPPVVTDKKFQQKNPEQNADQQLAIQLPDHSVSAERNPQPLVSYYQREFTTVRQLQFQVGGLSCPVMYFPPPQFAEFHPHHYQLILPPPPQHHPAGNFMALAPPPPQKVKHAPAAVTRCKQMWVPLKGMVVTERQRKTRRSFGKKRPGNDGYAPAGKRSGFVGENKDVGKWAYASKYTTVALKKKERDTTVMLKNIPYEYTPTMLVEFMDEFCKAENGRNKSFLTAYDFLYLPMDFKTNMGKGYAFINFSHPDAAWNFFASYDQTPWPKQPSHSKSRNIVRARIQGKNALVRHFERSNFECDTIEFLPRSFDPARDGSGGKVKVTPVGRRISRY